MGEHTALPWRAHHDVIVSDTPNGGFKTTAIAYYGDEMRHSGGLPFGAERDANAALIVKAVNSHDALVTALEGTIAWFESENFVPKVEGARIGSVHIGPVTKGVFDLAREALAKAATS